MKRMLEGSYLVLEGFRSKALVERCQFSGKTLEVVFYLLLLKATEVQDSR